jgi:hypothetical protein
MFEDGDLVEVVLFFFKVILSYAEKPKKKEG